MSRSPLHHVEHGFLERWQRAISGSVVTWFWHWLGRGLSPRLTPILNLFRRRR